MQNCFVGLTFHIAHMFDSQHAQNLEIEGLNKLPQNKTIGHTAPKYTTLVH